MCANVQYGIRHAEIENYIPDGNWKRNVALNFKLIILNNGILSWDKFIFYPRNIKEFVLIC